MSDPVETAREMANAWKRWDVDGIYKGELQSDVVLSLVAEAERLREALEEAQQFIESEFRDPSQEAHGDWLAREARPIHSLICAALGGKP